MDAAGGHEAPRRLKNLQSDRSGMALIYVTAALPVIIGLAVLAIDYSRLSILQSTLQHGGDALALAGAAELDGRPDSIDRSKAAIANLVTTNESLFATSVVTIDEAAVTTHYLDEIPSNDADPINSTWLAAHETTDGTEARFVQVKVDPQDFQTIMPAAFLGGPTAARPTAKAVGGFRAAVCKFTPLFMCNPFEPLESEVADPNNLSVYDDYGFFDSVKQNSNRRKLLALKSHSSQWAAGNFGFLEPSDGPGASRLMKAIASVNPQACFIVDNLSTQTGNIEAAKNAFNARFDLYPNGAIGSVSATSFPPAVNVRKSYVVKKKSGNGTPSNCNDNNPTSDFTATGEPAYNEAMPLPRDSCFADDSCAEVNGRLGGGDWGGDMSSDPLIPDFEQYWAINHPGVSMPTRADLGIVDDDDPTASDAADNSDPPTRYSVYRYETDNGLISDSSLGPTYVETGAPVCNAGIATDNPDRRIIYGAIVNCRANGLDGGKTTGIVAVAFAKFFMTEPMIGDSATGVTLWTEIVDVVEQGDPDGVARDIVQLYR